MPYKVIDGKIESLNFTAEQIMMRLKDEEIKFLDLQFTGLTGRFHHTTMASNMFKKEDFEYGLPKLDGSSIRGFTEIHESDLIIRPDPSTYAIIPWIKEDKTARLICDILSGGENRKQFKKDPRGIARKAEEYVRHQGYYNSFWGPEVEFFVFDKLEVNTMTPYRSQSYNIISKEAPWSTEGVGYALRLKEGYLPSAPGDTLMQYRNECVDVLSNNFGIICDAHHHEVATAGQCEIDIRFDTLVNAADSVQSYKYIVKNIAKKQGMIATMMPKPIALDNGSGMHVNVSLWDKEKNLFYDINDSYAEMSQLARYFAAGVLNHAPALAAIVAPTTNSYRRLVPGYEAPVYIAWSTGNRSAIIRNPAHYKGERFAHMKRIEFRAPDPSCNPYLAFSAIISAGLDGIKRKTSIPDPIDEDIFKMAPQRRRELGIRQLPPSLREAYEELNIDREFLKPIFDDEIIDSIILQEAKDHQDVTIRPHPHEFSLYADV
ncbi:MAG TPA: type I glutamate--ammonia ligase [Candidatus Nitrosocosmicus sp.]|nr:type I glutamate--ammonia ligase [Candidatus Nitrosocosmicus sp.]